MYLMRFLLFLLLILNISSTGTAQSTFEKLYFPSSLQYGRRMFQTPDHGFLIQGTIEQGYRNCAIIRTNEYGDTIWTKQIGTDSIQYYAYDVTATNDGGFLICGDYQTVLTDPSMDSYVQKIDSSGNQVWFNLFGWTSLQGGGKDYAELIKTLDDGSIIVEGTTKDYYVDIGNYIFFGFNWRSYIAKFDTAGNISRIRTVSLVLDTTVGQNYQARDIETIGNRLFWLGSNYQAVFPPNGSTILVAFDSNLDTLFTNSVNLNNYYGLSKTSDNHLLLFGQGIITKMDTTGNVIWTTPNTSASKPYNFIEKYDGQLFSIGGDKYVSPWYGDFYGATGNQTVYLNKYTSMGILLDSTLFDLPPQNFRHLGYDILQTADSGFAFAGFKDQAIWLVKTDSSGNLFTSIPEIQLGKPVAFGPNPASETFTITSKQKIFTVRVVTVQGQILFDRKANGNQIKVDVSSYPDGLYTAIIKSANAAEYIKFSVMHP